MQSPLSLEESVSTHHVKVGNMKSGKVIFNAKAVEQRLLTAMINEQTDRLIEYAKKIMKNIGDAIQQYHSANHMDRYGNLLNSLCWGVSYRGELKGSGFYRDANSLRESYLHEWNNPREANKEVFPVNGHALASDYIQKYGAVFTEGWRVFFAILAPYWGYWEQGFNMKAGGHDFGFKKFSVMTWFYDTVQKDLKPAKVYFKGGKGPTYSHSYNLGKTRIKGSLERAYDSWERKSPKQ